MCLSVASVPFFGGGGRFGRSWGMRQSRPGRCARSWCAARRAWLAVAPSNDMRAACGELAAPVLIVPINMYINPLFGRAMIPRLWPMGGGQRLHSKCLSQTFLILVLCRGPPAVRRSPCEGFCRRVSSRVSRGYYKFPKANRGPEPLRAAACLAASSKGSRQVVVSLANRSLRSLQRKGVEHSFWAWNTPSAFRSTAQQKHKFPLYAPQKQ